ncbi:MAG: DUF2066 domain-containing protein [Alphaproteobacteria bacterium]|nr:DUF2066 domain-containing protein [Alphaproteobacteria bacterium]MDE2336710.1 DUF2066 domain-containing protein [Alphaproteobacteria bacterium]
MLNHRSLAYCLLLSAFLAAAAGFSAPAHAQAAPPPTVTGIHVDKTDKNAVVAREKAIVAAQRTAFELLAEKSMTPDAFKNYQVPDDATIESLVRDFQISNEQMSSDRYVADFTVRFTPQLSNYITVPAGLGVVQASPGPVPPAAAAVPAAASVADSADATDEGAGTDMASGLSGVAPAPAETAPAKTVPAARRNILVLPYLEQTDGSRILWDDPNPWRDAWQDKGTSRPQPRLTVTVPLGDLTDVSSGDPEAVWKGDYRTIEELRANYSATAVAVLLAHMSPDAGGVDIYLYRDGTFTRLQTVSGTFDDAASFKKAIPLVIGALEAPQPNAAPVSSSMPQTPLAAPVPVVNEPAPAAAQMSVAAMMDFGSFAQWMEAQKRLAAVVPPLSIEISGLTTHAAQFTISFDGSLSSLRAALAAQGLVIDRPVVDVGASVLGSDAPTQRTVYELKLAKSAPAAGGGATIPAAGGGATIPAAGNAASVPAAAGATVPVTAGGVNMPAAAGGANIQ